MNNAPSPPVLQKTRLKRDGLEVGTQAPLFRVPRVGGGEVTLDDYLGRPLLLMFSDPSCGPCNRVAPQLQALHRRTPDIEVILISRGDQKLNLQKAQEFGLTFPVGLQRHWEVSLLYAMFATPIAYYINEHGVIAANVAEGPNAILTLLTSAAILSLLQTCPKETAGVRVSEDEKDKGDS